MRAPNHRPKCAWVFCLVLLLNAHFIRAQESPANSPDLVSDTRIVSPGSDNRSVYHEVVHLAELPKLDLPAAPPAPAVGPNATIPSVATSPQHPVALANYEEPVEEKPTAKTTPAAEPANALSKDPLFTFGGLLPVDEQSVDRWRLSRLQESYDDLNERASESTDGNEEVKEALALTFEWLRSGVTNLDRIDRLRQETLDQPENLKKLEDAIRKPLPTLPRVLEENQSLQVYKALLVEHRGHEQRLQTELNAAESVIRERTQQLTSHAKLEAQLIEKLGSAKNNIDNHQGNSLLMECRQLENRATEAGTKINLRLLATEQKWLSATEKSTFLQRDWLKRQLENSQEITKELSQQVATLQDEAIRAEAKTAHKEAQHAHPLLRGLAEEIAVLADQRTDVSDINRSNLTEQQSLDQELRQISNSRKKLDEHLAAAGHSQAVGLLLRFERTKLPQTSESQQKILDIESSLPDLKLKQLDINEQMENLPAQQAEIEQAVETFEPSASEITANELGVQASELLNKKRDYLYDLNSEYETYLNGLAKLQQSHEQLLDDTNELQSYIDQHVLWIRSAEPFDSEDLSESLEAIRAIGTSDQWQAMVGFLRTRLQDNWFLIFFLIAGLWLGIGMRQQLDRRLRQVCQKRSDFRIAPLVRSVFFTAFQASLLPALVGTLGWLLSSGFATGTLKDSIARGVLSITPQLFIASFVFRMSIRGGLAEKQFGWSREICDCVRAASGTIARYCLPLFAITEALEVYDEGLWIDSLGRLIFIFNMLLLAFTAFRLIRSIGKTWRSNMDQRTSIWEQTFSLWSPVVVLLPIALVCVAACGFMYSSMFLGIRLMMTWWLVMGFVAAYFLMRRIIDIGHNIIIARRRWRPNFDTEYPEMANGNLTVDNEINAIRSQVTRLLHVASVAICLLIAFSFWADVLPAIKALDYGLYQVNRQVETLGPDQKTMIAVTKLSWVTLGDTLRFILVLGITIVVSRNIPGLMQMVILDRLPLDRGGKYAISIVCRYVVGALGLALASRMIGLTWGSVQWLVAAMSVGLGFGLQEIFANFIAGIIILLERPIRVGDFVTVNGTKGFVTKIQLRATMIIDYDRRELIVPNKKFITDDVINWTLSDSITRIVIPVGIAYGSDTQLAQEVLLKVARSNSSVLPDPSPEVIFMSFGGSSLDFELRVHIANRESYHAILHQLHMAIDLAFRQHQIEIAFPQQDIHVRGAEALLQIAERTSSQRAA